VDETHGNAVAAFDRMGRPDTPSRAQIVQLREADKLAAPESMAVHGGKLAIDVPVQGLVVIELR
jgi:xylan 1,4-beta-xylosidase